MKLAEKIVEALQRGGYLSVGNEEIPEVVELVEAISHEHIDVSWYLRARILSR
jgi:chemotaxis methyl-accepting protein methylase